MPEDRELSNEGIAQALFTEVQNFCRTTSEAIIALNQRQLQLESVCVRVFAHYDPQFLTCKDLFEGSELRLKGLCDQMRSVIAYIDYQKPPAEEDWQK